MIAVLIYAIGREEGCKEGIKCNSTREKEGR
jgi:hypothetical protein